jgi:ribose transport system substrate-binding protein
MKMTMVVLVSIPLVALSLATGCASNSTKASEGTSKSATVSTNQSSSTDAKTEASAPKEKKAYTIGFLNTLVSSKWRAQLMEDAKNGAEQLKAKGKLNELIIQSCQNDVNTQLNQLNNLINKKVDAILLDPASTTALGASVQKAIDAGILVLIVQDAAPYKGTYVISDNNELMATALSTWLAQEVGGKGEIVELTGIPGHSDDTVRVNKMHEVLKANFPDVKIIASAPTHYNYAEAQSVISQDIATFGNRIKGVLSQDDMAPGTLLAFKNSNTPYVPMVGHTSKSFLADWKKENLNAIAYSIYTGKIVDAMNIAIRMLDGEKINPAVLTPNSFDSKLVNQIRLESPYIVTNKAMSDAPWMKGLKVTKSISVDEAIELTKGKSDDWALDKFMTDAELDGLFLK